MFENFGAVLLAVADHWFFWIGLLLVIEPYLEATAPSVSETLKHYFVKHPQYRRRVFQFAGAAALLIAFFQAWNIQYQSATRDINRIAMKDLLGVAIYEGEKINVDWSKRTDDAAFTHQTNVWINKVGHLVQDAYGSGELRLLFSDAGYMNYTDGKTHTTLHNEIIDRLSRLNELLVRVGSLPMEPGFDPKRYHWVPDCTDC